MERTPPPLHNTRGNHDNNFVRLNPYAAGESVETVNGNGANRDASNVQSNASDAVEEGVVNEQTRTPNNSRYQRLQESILRRQEGQPQQAQDDRGGGDGFLHTSRGNGSPSGNAELNISVRRSTPNPNGPEFGNRALVRTDTEPSKSSNGAGATPNQRVPSGPH